MKRVMVILNEEHKLFPEQEDLLNSGFGPRDWDILAVPPEGWDLETIIYWVASFRSSGCCHIVFASPVPALMVKLAKLANARGEEWPVLWAFHNDKRTSKEVPDGKGGTRIIKTVSPTGWKLTC